MHAAAAIGLSAHAAAKYTYPIGSAAFGSMTRSQDNEDVALYEQFFRHTWNGTFVEMGALNGEVLSNTYAFEKARGWTGVLIEANPVACRSLHRKPSHRPGAVKLCTAVSRDYATLTFEDGKYSATFGAVDEGQAIHSFFNNSHGRRKRHQIPSAPLGQLLRSVGIASVDLFSLDVEGSEVKVLQTMDWSIPVRVWCIEWQPKMSPISLSNEIAAIMTRHGYERHEWWHVNDSTKPLVQNQLWVWREPWTPERYAWRQWNIERDLEAVPPVL